MSPDQKPRLVSLFAGIGGFDLGFDRVGFQTVGQCEIDPHAVSVLQRHWPDAQRHDDVTTLTGLQFGPADVVTFGSPCQDLSVAGKRAGLAGERSGLFLEAMRYIREMLEATDGKYPRCAIWENVPGSFSSNGGADFAAVLESMVGGTVRHPADGWATAGVAFGPQGSAEWRVVDSQHFGVAQRRRRVFVVYHPGGDSAGKILLERKGMRGDPEPGRETRESTTGSPARSTGNSGHAIGLSGEFNAAHELQPALDTATGGHRKPMVGIPVLNDQGGQRMDLSQDVTGTLLSVGHTPIIPDVSPTVTSKWAKGTGGPAGDEVQNLVVTPAPVAFKIRGGVSVDSEGKGAGKGYLGSEDIALTLGTVQDMFLAEPMKPERAPQQEPVAFPIQDGVRLLKDQGGLGVGSETDPMYTLDTTGHQAVAFAAHAPYAVRRLTPTECERLQGFPDGWTARNAAGKPVADTHRYRMLGNAVTVNVAEWIGQRLKDTLANDAE